MIVEHAPSLELPVSDLLTRVRLASLSLAIAVDRKSYEEVAAAVGQMRAAFHATQMIASRRETRGGAWMIVLLRAAQRWGRLVRLHPHAELGDWTHDFSRIIALRDLDSRWVELSDLDIDDLDLEAARFCGARLERVSARRSRLDAVDLSLARLSRCRFKLSSMIAADLDAAELTEVDLSGAVVRNSNWQRALVRSCSFAGADCRDANLENAWFSDRSFRGCDVSLTCAERGAPSSVGARFIRCDLRGTTWSNRDLAGATFIDCAFHAACGTAGLGSGVRIDKADASSGANRSRFVTRDEIGRLGSWRRHRESLRNGSWNPPPTSHSQRHAFRRFRKCHERGSVSFHWAGDSLQTDQRWALAKRAGCSRRDWRQVHQRDRAWDARHPAVDTPGRDRARPPDAVGTHIPRSRRRAEVTPGPHRASRHSDRGAFA